MNYGLPISRIISVFILWKIENFVGLLLRAYAELKTGKKNCLLLICVLFYPASNSQFPKLKYVERVYCCPRAFIYYVKGRIDPIQKWLTF